MENVFEEACNALLVTITEIELGTADGSDEIKVYDEVFSQRKIPRNSDEG